MKDKITIYLGPDQTKRVEKKIAETGKADAVDIAIYRAQSELPSGKEEEQVERAAVRLQQSLGLIPRPKYVAPAEPKKVEVAAPAAPAPDASAPEPAAKAAKSK